jgi:ribosomal protein S18 acetylase RimI-like enzyme
MNASIREAATNDLEAIISIDTQITGVIKRDYWQGIFKLYTEQKMNNLFLVAELDGAVVGFIIGEVKAWEFGSPLCGWVFAIGVKQGDRLAGVGTQMLDALSSGFRGAGVTKVRTMVARQNHELLAFFRSQGMMAGPYLQLEKELE